MSSTTDDISKILLFGGNGLCGKEFLRYAVSKKLRLRVVLRPTADTTDITAELTSKFVEVVKNDFKNLNALLSPTLFENVTTVVVCLGTTRSKAGSAKAQYDFEVKTITKIAQVAKANNVQQFILISATGANPKSYFFFNKMKGVIENNVLKQNIPQTIILRPSFLLGVRKNDFRFFEYIISNFAHLFLPQKGIYNHSYELALIMVNYICNKRPESSIILSSADIYNHKKKLDKSKSTVVTAEKR